MEFFREHRIILICYILLAAEVFLFRNSLLPFIALASMLILLSVKVVKSEITLLAERMINILSVSIVIIISTILILQAL